MASYAFRISGIAPADSQWHTAGESVHRSFWKEVVRLVLIEKDKELAAGLDRHGRPMIPIAESTRKKGKWRSHTGLGDPDAPPLDPAYALSRTRSLFTGRAHADHAEFFWLFDVVTGKHWGKILGYHRAGSSRLPIRDVIGLSPQSLARVQKGADRWWANWKRHHAQQGQIKLVPAAAGPQAPPRPVPPRPKIERPKLVPPVKVDLSSLTFGIGAGESDVRQAIEEGSFSGFQFPGVKGRWMPPGSPPPPPAAGGLAGPKPIRPKPPKPTYAQPIGPSYFSGHPVVHDRVPKPEGKPPESEKWEPPPPPKPKPKKPAVPKDVFPKPTDVLTDVKALGGSTGAKLVTSPTGKKFVAKNGSSEGQIRSEAAADKAYQVLGVPVAESRLYERPPGGPQKLAVFHEGKTLGELMQSDPAAAEAAMVELRKHFVADALMGNWDVIGTGYDNILVTPAGKVLRIDNGGSLRYRAQGGLKSAAQFSGNVGELTSMRFGSMNPYAAKVFGSVTDVEIRQQAKAILKKKDTFLAALPDDVRDTMKARLAFLQTIADAKPPKPPKGVKGWKATDESTFRPPFTTGMDSWGKQHFSAWAQSLTDVEKTLVKSYTGSGHSAMNDHIRSGAQETDPTSAMSTGNRKLAIALRRAELPESITVWRGVRKWSDLKIPNPENLPYGFEISEKAFGSTSLSEDVSRAFAGGGSEPVLFKLLAPKGMQGAYVNAAGENSSHKGEKEFLLPPAFRYRVIRVERPPGTNIPVVTAELIP